MTTDHAEAEKLFSGLSPAEIERLSLLMEECGEVIQAAAKVLRHGWKSVNPILRDQLKHAPTNRDSLAKEIGQLHFAMDLVATHDVDPGSIVRATNHKRDTIKQWLHHNKDNVP